MSASAAMTEVMTEDVTDFKQLLRTWIEQHASRSISGGLQDDTPLLEQRVISSLQVMELLLFIEKTSGKPVQAAQLKPAVFRSINSIHNAFFAESFAETFVGTQP